MKIFKDASGREWIIDLNLDARNQIKERVTIDIKGNQTPLDLLDVEAAQRLSVIGDMQDAALIGQVLWVLCSEQAEKQSIDCRAFFKSIKGDVFDDACAALQKELTDFFPKHRRALMSAAVEKAQHLQNLMIQNALEKLDSTELEETLQREMQRITSEASTSLRGSSESILET